MQASVVIRILLISIAQITHALLVKSSCIINRMEFFVMAVIDGLIDGVLG